MFVAPLRVAAAASPLVVTSTFNLPPQWPNLHRQATLLVPEPAVWLVIENSTHTTQRTRHTMELAAEWFAHLTGETPSLTLFYLPSQEPSFAHWQLCPTLRGWNTALDFIAEVLLPDGDAVSSDGDAILGKSNGTYSGEFPSNSGGDAVSSGGDAILGGKDANSNGGHVVSGGGDGVSADDYVLFFLPEHATVLPALVAALPNVSRLATWNVGRAPFVELAALDLHPEGDGWTLDGWVDPRAVSGPPSPLPTSPLQFAANLGWLRRRLPDISAWKWDSCEPGDETQQFLAKFNVSVSDFEVLYPEDVLVWDSWTATILLQNSVRRRALTKSAKFNATNGQALYDQIADWDAFWQ